MKKYIFAVLAAAILLFSACPPPETPPAAPTPTPPQLAPQFDYDVLISTYPKVGSVSFTVTGSTSAAGVELLFLAQNEVEGYLFDHWEGDVTGTANPVSLYAQDDVTVVAVYARAYTLTLAVSPAGPDTGGIIIDPPGIVKSATERVYKTGTAVAISAPATSAGYIFNEWSGALTGSELDTGLVMDANKQLTAVYLDSGTSALSTVGAIAQEVVNKAASASYTTTNPEANIINYNYTIDGDKGGYCEYTTQVIFGDSTIINQFWMFYDYQNNDNNIVNSGATTFSLLAEPPNNEGNTPGTLSGDINLIHSSGYNLTMNYAYTYLRTSGQMVLYGQGLKSGTCTISCAGNFENRQYDHTYTPLP